MKRKIVINGPCYKNERSIYEKETLDKIEGFRRARRNWLASADDSQKTFTKVKEGMKESNIYNGRCSCLRKLRLKTTLLRVHYKNFRPFIYWTLKKKLTDLDVEEYEEMLQRETIKEKEPKRKLSKTVCITSEIWKKEDMDECLRDAAKLKGRLARKQKKKECMEKEVSGPCKKAIRRLKAAKIKDGIIESCKCEDGGEVTVVIKGICLCDKNSLNKLNLNKVCDEYSRIKKFPQVEGASGDASKQTKQTNTSKTCQENIGTSDSKAGRLHVIDPLETCRKIRSLHETECKRPNDKDIIDKVDTNASEGKKKLTFENEENLKGDGEGRRVVTNSDVTLYRNLPSDFSTKSDTSLKPKTTPPTSSHLAALKSPLKYESVLFISKPAELPQTESLNNLLINESKKTKAKGEYKKYPVVPDRKPSDEHVTPSQTPHMASSIEIYKKQWKKHSPKGEEYVKKEKTLSKEDLSGNRKHDKTTERKTKVRVNYKPTVIPPRNFPAETTPPHPETKQLASLETHDLAAYPRSWSENIEKKELQSKLNSSVSSRQKLEVNSNTDDTSIVTLFKNEPEAKSEMGLTKEEYERMKEVEKEEKNKRIKDEEESRQK